MKTLLALLMFVSISTAQTKEEILREQWRQSATMFLPPDTSGPKVYFDTTKTVWHFTHQLFQSGRPEVAGKTIVTLEDFQQYVRECETVTEQDLRDSLATLIGRIRVLIAQNDYASLHDIKLLLAPMGYKREPTLEGFMGWLEKRKGK